MPKLLTVGPCPICGKMIIEKGEKNRFYNEIWVKFSPDKSKAKFAVCNDCQPNLTQEQLDELMQRQIYTWGAEVARQLKWYYETAVYLRIIKKADSKDEL